MKASCTILDAAAVVSGAILKQQGFLIKENTDGVETFFFYHGAVSQAAHMDAISSCERKTVAEGGERVTMSAVFFVRVGRRIARFQLA